MSEGSIYKRKDGYWVAKYKDAAGQWKYLYRRTKGEARKALREALKNRDEGIVPATNITLNDLLDSWLEDMEGTVSRRTMVHRESIYRVHVKTSIGRQRVSKLSHKDFARLYRNKLSEGLKSSTVKCIHALLKQCFGDALRRKYISPNPMSDVKPPRQERAEKQILSPSQVRPLLESIRGHRFELAVYMGATCALRVSEVMSLKYSDFDMDRGTVTIQRTLWNGVVWSTKTTGSKRTLKLPQIALEAIQRRMTTAAYDGWLFPTKNDTPVATCNFHYPWKAMLRKAGLPESTTYHSLRHGVASTLLDRGVPLPVVSRYLRHANPGITASVYSHIVNGSENAASGGIDEALS